MQPASGGSADPRLDERSNVFLGATLHGASGSFDVRIRNISTMGAMIEGAILPLEGSRVDLERGSLGMQAEVAWQSGDFRGIRFDKPIDVGAWVRRARHAGQVQVDRVIKRLRAGTAPIGPRFAEREELLCVERLSDDILRICDRMASSPQLTVEIGEDIMRLEAIARSLRDLGSD